MTDAMVSLKGLLEKTPDMRASACEAMVLSTATDREGWGDDTIDQLRSALQAL